MEGCHGVEERGQGGEVRGEVHVHVAVDVGRACAPSRFQCTPAPTLWQVDDRDEVGAIRGELGCDGSGSVSGAVVRYGDGKREALRHFGVEESREAIYASTKAFFLI